MDCRRNIDYFIGKQALNHVDAFMVHGNAINSQNSDHTICMNAMHMIFLVFRLFCKSLQIVE